MRSRSMSRVQYSKVMNVVPDFSAPMNYAISGIVVGQSEKEARRPDTQVFFLPTPLRCSSKLRVGKLRSTIAVCRPGRCQSYKPMKKGDQLLTYLELHQSALANGNVDATGDANAINQKSSKRRLRYSIGLSQDRQTSASTPKSIWLLRRNFNAGARLGSRRFEGCRG